MPYLQTSRVDDPNPRAAAPRWPQADRDSPIRTHEPMPGTPSLTELRRIPTSGARAVESFELDGTR